MEICFQIRYLTSFGRNLCILTKRADAFVQNGAESEEGSEERIMLNCEGQDVWTKTMILSDFVTTLHYRYAILCEDGSLIRETGPEHCLRLNGTYRSVKVEDWWQDDNNDRLFRTAVFQKAIFLRKKDFIPMPSGHGNIRFTLDLPCVQPGQGVAVMGNIPELGNWNSTRKRVMDDSHYPVWEADIHYEGTEDVQYKYCIFDKATGEITDLEDGENRRVGNIAPDRCLIRHDYGFRYSQCPFRGSGVVVPVFALRTENSFGIGEYCDLKKLAEWATETGWQMIQTLPVNDTTLTGTERDSYPYSPVSVFALHPIYLNIPEMGTLPPKEAKRYSRLKKDLEQMRAIDYTAVYKTKTAFFKVLFREDGERTLHGEPYRRFYQANKDWLDHYATYCAQRDGEIADLYRYLQFHADRQLSAAVTYAHSLGVAVKGDIPIGVNAQSDEVQTHPALFHTESSAGAPPDDFAMDGQNWGFPTYNWDRMAEDGYAWWCRRLQKMEEYFDAYRIDHILGFFRIWQMRKGEKGGLHGQFFPSLPYTMKQLHDLGIRSTADQLVADDLFVRDQHNSKMLHPRILLYKTPVYRKLPSKVQAALMSVYNDYFYHRHTEYWRYSALRKLPTLIQSNNMLCCGEDLGMVPSCVPEVMQELKILSLEIQRMPKDPSVRFGNPSHAPYLSVCATGTHDTSTLRSWWEEDREATRLYYRDFLKGEGEAPLIMSPEIAEQIIRKHMQSSAMWVILPLQDWLAVDGTLRCIRPEEERINDPSNPDQVWNYRMHITIEDLLQARSLNNKIKEMARRR